ncbi:MAG: hypothetical protein ACD_5C00250G0003 [uncultured bacterium]|nr:MAG: hypothetical protein ACD_5C00250G0003 [uncultured bacterium]
MEKNNINKSEKFQSSILLLLRIIAASIFLYAGIAKWQFMNETMAGTPQFMVYLIKFLAIVEPLGAFAMLAGFLTRWAASGLSVIMLGSIGIVKFTMGTVFFTGPQATGWDYNAMLFAICLSLLAFGPGKWSMDEFLSKRRCVN